ncbi:hypothetical protein, partial [Nocardia sp. NPDC004722]
GWNATEYDVKRVALGGKKIDAEVTLASMFATHRLTTRLTNSIAGNGRNPGRLGASSYIRIGPRENSITTGVRFS